jgi:ABC-2 type transport system ATP-binding protein
LLAAHPGVDKVEPRDSLLYVTLKDGVTDYSELSTLLVSNGLKLTLFREEELNLETAFMALTKGITS